MPEADELDAFPSFCEEGMGFSALGFVHGLLDDAVDEFSEEAVREAGFAMDAMLVQAEREPPIPEADDEDAVEEDDADDDAGSVFSCASAAENSFFKETMAFEDAARELAEDIVRDVADDMTQKATKEPELPISTADISTCTRSAFQRRLRLTEEGAPVREAVFPSDCLPCSTPVARAVPPAAELAAIDRFEVSSRTLSSEADEKITFAAANAFSALRALAEAEASFAIQCHWRHRQAGRMVSLANAKVSAEFALPMSAPNQLSPRPPTSPSNNSSAPRRRPGARPASAATPSSGSMLSERMQLQPPTGPTAPAGPRPCRRGGRPTLRTAVAAPTATVECTFHEITAVEDVAFTPRLPKSPKRSTPVMPSPRASAEGGLHFPRKAPATSRVAHGSAAAVQPEAGPTALEIDMGFAPEPPSVSSRHRARSIGTGLLPSLTPKGPHKAELISWSTTSPKEKRSSTSLTPRSSTALLGSAAKIVMNKTHGAGLVL